MNNNSRLICDFILGFITVEFFDLCKDFFKGFFLEIMEFVKSRSKLPPLNKALREYNFSYKFDNHSI